MYVKRTTKEKKRISRDTQGDNDHKSDFADYQVMPTKFILMDKVRKERNLKKT